MTAEQRKNRPVFSGVMMYFPDALLEVANCSYVANEQHNPGEPLHWARSKSADELDAMMRHALQATELDDDGILHAAKVAWRALAYLQKTIEERNGLENCMSFTSPNIQHVSKPVPVPVQHIELEEKKLEVGTRVIVTGNTSEHDFNVGDIVICTDTECSESHRYFDFKNEITNEEYYMKPSDFKILP